MKCVAHTPNHVAFTDANNVLNHGFLTGGTKHYSRGYEMRRQNNGSFKIFAKNLFSMLFEIKNIFQSVF